MDIASLLKVAEYGILFFAIACGSAVAIAFFYCKFKFGLKDENETEQETDSRLVELVKSLTEVVKNNTKAIEHNSELIQDLRVKLAEQGTQLDILVQQKRG
jgi:hypothetical protein